MSQPLVSIVTPIYNGAEFLAECIESVLAQTYPNWDYTLLDNCSTDNSVEIARRYAAMDPRIRVQVNQEFLRAIPNHNAALRQASPASKYCKVVFADDWISPECLERMVRLAEANPSVGIVSAYCLEGQQVICTGLPYSSQCVSGREICRRHLLSQLYLFGSANSLLYRADLVRSRNPFFNEANIHADTEVCFALLKSSDFGFVHQVLTFTRVRPGSLNTVSADLHSYFAGMLHILQTYGPDYLTREELDGQLGRRLAEYYQFLGKSVFLRRDRTFWQYHRKQLKALGFGFSRIRLAGAALGNLCGAALSPGATLKKLAGAGRD
jgi:glycosyltransferase involved in cell wall biosynthesis